MIVGCISSESRSSPGSLQREPHQIPVWWGFRFSAFRVLEKTDRSAGRPELRRSAPNLSGVLMQTEGVKTSKIEMATWAWSSSTGECDWLLRPQLATESFPPSDFNSRREDEDLRRGAGDRLEGRALRGPVKTKSPGFGIPGFSNFSAAQLLGEAGGRRIIQSRACGPCARPSSSSRRGRSRSHRPEWARAR